MAETAEIDMSPVDSATGRDVPHTRLRAIVATPSGSTADQASPRRQRQHSAFATRRRHWRAGALEQRMPFAFHTDRHSPLTSNPSTLICQRALSWSEYEAIYDALENVFVLVELIGR